MAWVLIVLAGMLEAVMALALKESQAFTKLWPALLFLVTAAASFALLALALRELPVGTAYAAWTGLGAVGTALLGIVLLGESASLTRLLAIALTATGIVWLALQEGAQA